jgi:dTDP-4-amino-4,6-dideoxygalactose transaminase
MKLMSRPNIPNRERLFGRIEQALDDRRLSNDGPFVQELEQQIAKLHQVRHCVAVSSGTVGLEIAVRALGLEGEVILPSFTFIATAHVLQWLGIRPVFCDVAGHNIDPNRIEELITPRTTGIMGVHVWGRPCQTERLERIAREHDLQLLFDAAHAFGCSHRGRMIGRFGDAEVFSFHATKVFHTLEGGAILTDDDEVAEKAQLLRNFGFLDYDDVVCLGINGKMNEISAAAGLTMLEQLDEIVAANLRNHRRYQAELEGLEGIRLVEHDDDQRNNYHYVVIEVDEGKAGISRNDLIYALDKEGIVARRYFYPGCHRMEPYRSLQPHAGLLLPETERLVERVMVLPSGTAIEERDVIRVCQVIRSYTGC